MALIRSTSLTRSHVRISLRGICVLSVNEVAETWKVPSEAAKWCSNSASAEDGLPPIPHTDGISSHNPGFAYPPTFLLFIFIPPTVSFEANNQFIKVFYRIRALRKAPDVN
jgi:hypothetical protein